MVFTGKEKEKETSMRIRLQNEIKKARNHMENIIELLAEEDEVEIKVLDGAKSVLGELMVFDTEIDLSESGHKYAWFSDQQSIKRKDVKKIKEFEKDFMDNLQLITKASEMIEGKIIDEDDMELKKEMRKLRQYITKARNAYKDRIEFIKKI